MARSMIALLNRNDAVHLNFYSMLERGFEDRQPDMREDADVRSLPMEIFFSIDDNEIFCLYYHVFPNSQDVSCCNCTCLWKYHPMKFLRI